MWGAPGSELTGSDVVSDTHDPNYDSDSQVSERQCFMQPFAFTNCVCIGLAVFAFKALEIPCLFAFSGGKTQKCKYYY